MSGLDHSRTLLPWNKSLLGKSRNLLSNLPLQQEGKPCANTPHHLKQKPMHRHCTLCGGPIIALACGAYSALLSQTYLAWLIFIRTLPLDFHPALLSRECSRAKGARAGPQWRCDGWGGGRTPPAAPAGRARAPPEAPARLNMAVGQNWVPKMAYPGKWNP